MPRNAEEHRASPCRWKLFKVPSKLGWLSEGFMVIRGVRNKVVTRSVARICSAMSDASFEVLFKDVTLEALFGGRKTTPDRLARRRAIHAQVWRSGTSTSGQPPCW